MTRRERAHAQAVNEFEAMHGGPASWAPWEREQYEVFVAAREAALLDVTDPESFPGALIGGVA